MIFRLLFTLCALCLLAGCNSTASKRTQGDTNNSGDSELRVNALKQVRRHYSKNTYILDLYDKQLLEESPLYRYRYLDSTNYYAWLCRILGESGHSKYITTLDEVFKTALQKKVRKYAKKFRVVLEKTNRKKISS